MPSFNPLSHREDRLKADISAAQRDLQAEKSADPEAFERRIRRANEDAARFQRIAQGKRP